MSEENYELQNLNQNNENSVITFQNDTMNVIDFVLVYTDNEEKRHERSIFERNLQDVGLKIFSLDTHETIEYKKIYAPKQVLLKYCEIMKLCMPVKEISDRNTRKPSRTKLIINRFYPKLFAEKKHRLTAQFSRNKSYLFDVDSENFFTSSVRNMIVGFILSNEKFTNEQEDENNDDEEDNYGISELIARGAYMAAYPLHSDRTLLLNEWGSLNKVLKVQPLDAIKDYFGIKISLYFAWIGFYSYMLIPASILGIICMIYGLMTLDKDNISTEVCKSDVDIIMCPQCDKHCDYWKLRDICTFSLITHLFDNTSTVIFAVLMSLWCAVYLNLWSRYSARIIHRWGMTNELMVDNDLPTEQYLNSKAIYRGKYCDRVQRISFSFAIILFWILLVVAIVLGLMFYRISLSTSEKIFGVKGWIVLVTGSIFDLITIIILNHFYDQIAHWLTEKELHRTQAEFERSLTCKIYLFWFVNYYSSIIYVAFIKGKFVGRPGAYQRIFGFRQEECGPGGCIVDLFIQLAIVMIGDLTYNNIVEYLVPWVQKKIRAYRINSVQDDAENQLISPSQWVEDLKLLYWGNNELVTEYLEMVLQYGFVTLFVAAFPLAPLVALINNVFEIRMDARKLLTNYRRPVAQNAHNIGAWLTIMNVVSKMSILSNACIIAFSTNFIPQIFFKYVLSSDTSNSGFFNHTLAYFNTSEFSSKVLPLVSEYENVSLCRYTDYRNPPWHEDKYDLSKFYWHILAAKLIFVLIYQNFVVVLQMIVCWIIPEMPKSFQKYIMNEAIRTQKLILMKENAHSRQ